jgi:hypothetical protein
VSVVSACERNLGTSGDCQTIRNVRAAYEQALNKSGSFSPVACIEEVVEQGSRLALCGAAKPYKTESVMLTKRSRPIYDARSSARPDDRHNPGESARWPGMTGPSPNAGIRSGPGWRERPALGRTLGMCGLLSGCGPARRARGSAADMPVP